MKKTIKWTAVTAIAIMMTAVALTALIYFPPFQRWAVGKVTAYASEQTGMDIRIERVGLSFPLNLEINGLHIGKPNDSIPNLTDTIANARELVVDVRLLPLFGGNVEIDALRFTGVRLNTDGLIHSARISGRLDRLCLESHGIDISAETVRVDSALIAGADLSIELADTVPEDTTKSENRWKVNIDRLHIDDSSLALHMPGDTMSVCAGIGNLAAADAHIDLYRSQYKVGRMKWNGGRLTLDYNYEPHKEGLDINHLALTDITLDADSFDFCSPKINLNIRQSSFRENSGLNVRSLASHIAVNAKKISVPDIKIVTTESQMSARFVMDRNTFSETAPGKMHLRADGSLGKQDIMLFMADMPEAFRKRWPAQPLKVNTVLTGNMRHLVLTGLVADLPTAFHINAHGTIDNIADPDNMRASLFADARAHDIGFLASALPAGTLDGIAIPRGIGIKGKLFADGKRFGADFRATEGGGTLAGRACVNTSGNMTYKANLTARGLHLGHFLPRKGLGTFSGQIAVRGSGTDIHSPGTRIEAGASITKFAYSGYDLSGMSGKLTMRSGHAIAGIRSNNPLVKGNMTVDALINKRWTRATVGADFQHIDLYRLRLAESPLSTAFCAHVDVATDMDQTYRVNGSATDVMVNDNGREYYPGNIDMSLLMNRDTTHLAATNGDFLVNFDARGGHKTLMRQIGALMAQMKEDLGDKVVDQSALQAKLPTAHIKLDSGSDNFVNSMMSRFGYSFADAKADITSSPQTGLNGSMEIHRLIADSVQLDTVRLALYSDGGQFRFKGQVRNNIKNPQYVFNAFIDGSVMDKGIALNVRYYDQRDVMGVRLGATAEMEDDGIRLHMLTDNPVIGYKSFTVNDDNYVFIGKDRRLSARLKMHSDDGVEVMLSSADDNADALQDLSLSVNRVKIGDLVAVLPYMPRMSGTASGDFHFIQTKDEDISVNATMSVENMTYEGSTIGNLGTEFVYMPKDDGSQYVDGIIYSDGTQVATVSGTYRTEGNGYLDAAMNMERMPLSVLNGMMPDKIVALEGTADGSLDIRGQLGKPQVDGSLALNDAYLVSETYGMRMRFDTMPVQVMASKVQFKDFNLYSGNGTPMSVNGNVDFSDLDDITMKIGMAAQNFQIIDSKETRHSEAFGKAYVDFACSLTGSLDQLRMRGRMDVLGSTDMSYVLRDNPLTADYQMDELVRFTDFTDTTQTATQQPAPMSFDMDLMVNIDRAARVMCYLNDDHSNYVDLTGDGALRMRYTPSEGFRIRGKYTLNNGEMKYSMPVIPLKTFTIRDGSRIEFTGDPMNPRLDITATQHTKSTVTTAGQNRSVDFECGVVISKTMQDMGLQFIISAPEDMAVQDELNMMSEEEQGKLAVAMLTTGMYLSGGNNTTVSMNNTLSSFLQSQINSIAGNALRTIDISFGLDNAIDASGGMHTDYSFRFAKRFWNNRLRVVVGGKISTGSNINSRDQAFFDNVTFEYRLSQTSNKYMKMFYNHGAYDWLEGENSEYGVGFIWRRKVNHFSEIFRKETDNGRMNLDKLRSARDTTNNKANEKKERE